MNVVLVVYNIQTYLAEPYAVKKYEMITCIHHRARNKEFRIAR